VFTPTLTGLGERGHLARPEIGLEIHVRDIINVIEYEDLLEDVLAQLTADNLATAVELAVAPDLVRGYEEVKVASVERYRARVAQLQAQMKPTPVA